MRLRALIPLLEINKALVTDRTQEEIFDAIMGVALSEIKADRVSIMLINENTEDLVVMATKGILTEKVQGYRTKVGRGVSGWVAKTGEGVLLNNRIHSNPVIKDAMNLNEVYSGMSVPLIIKGKTLGVINLSKIKQTSPFTKSDFDLFSIISGQKVLYKPGKLTDEEYEIMKAHPFHGERILEPIGFSEEIIKSIRHHHEWYNGKGYPEGLKGKEISIGARILCIADTLEAMTTR